MAFCVGLVSGLIWGSLGFCMGLLWFAFGILELETVPPQWRGADGGNEGGQYPEVFSKCSLSIIYSFYYFYCLICIMGGGGGYMKNKVKCGKQRDISNIWDIRYCQIRCIQSEPFGFGLFGSLPFLAFCVGLGSGLIWGSLGFWMGFWRGAVGILELKTAKPKWRGAAGGDSPLRPGAFHSPRELPSPPRQPGGIRHCRHYPQAVSLVSFLTHSPGGYFLRVWGFIFYVFGGLFPMCLGVISYVFGSLFRECLGVYLWCLGAILRGV